MDKIREKIQTWPRWIRYGLVSGAVASILIIVWFRFNLSSSIAIIGLGTLAPVVWIADLTGIWDFPEWLGVVITIGLWSFLGVLLGKFTNKLGIAVLIWLAAQILGGLLLITYIAPLFY